MGIYYYFCNRTTGEDNKFPIFGKNITWYAKFHVCTSYKEKVGMFKWMARKNGWNDTDVLSCGSDSEYCPYYVYQNDIVLEFNEHKDEDAYMAVNGGKIVVSNMKDAETFDENDVELKRYIDYEPSDDESEDELPATINEKLEIEDNNSENSTEEDSQDAIDEKYITEEKTPVNKKHSTPNLESPPHSPIISRGIHNSPVMQCNKKELTNDTKHLQQLASIGVRLISSTKDTSQAMSYLLKTMKEQLDLNNELIHLLNEMKLE